MNKKILLNLFFLPILSLCFFTSNILNTQAVNSNLKGKILLQVEANGEAWYVNPTDEKRYYMGRPENAYNLMRELGVGISDSDISKIIISDSSFSGAYDGDGDGLSKMIEDSIGTDDNNSDTDGDGYTDKTEILNGYNPKGSGKIKIDNNFASKQSGKILLQVEKNGEAWYVNPNDEMRYFLGRPEDAFQVMRNLGLGITNNDLDKILVDFSIGNVPVVDSGQLNKEPKSYDENKKVTETESEISLGDEPECKLFAEKLDSCTEYSCVYIHPLAEELVTKKVVGFVDGECDVVEEIPNKQGEIECSFSKEERIVAANYFKYAPSFLLIGDINISLEVSFSDDGMEVVDKSDNVGISNIVKNPFEEFLDGGQCVISGGNNDNDKDLPVECEDFTENLDSCTEHVCIFIHPLTGDLLIRDIAGIEDGKCVYIEEMPNDGKMECNYTESERKVAADYYEEVLSGGSFSSEDDNPLQEFLDNGQCVILGYGDMEDEIVLGDSNDSNELTLNGDIEVKWGNFELLEKSMYAPGAWGTEVEFTNNSSDKVFISTERDRKRGNVIFSDGKYIIKSGELFNKHLFFDHYFFDEEELDEVALDENKFDELVFGKEKIEVKIYKCNDFSAENYEKICVPEYVSEDETGLIPYSYDEYKDILWDIINGKESGVVIQPSFVEVKYYDYFSTEISPEEISEEEYLK